MKQILLCGVLTLLVTTSCSTQRERENRSRLQQAESADVYPCREEVDLALRYVPKPQGTAWVIPRPPVYPSFSDEKDLTREAQCISNALDRYITAWFNGKDLGENQVMVTVVGGGILDRYGSDITLRTRVKVHYLTKEEFEALGAERLPEKFSDKLFWTSP